MKCLHSKMESWCSVARDDVRPFGQVGEEPDGDNQDDALMDGSQIASIRGQQPISSGTVDSCQAAEKEPNLTCALMRLVDA